MAVNTTTSFAPEVGDIAEEAYEMAGVELKNAYDIRSAIRSLDLMMLEWQNRGINLWTVEEQKTTTLTKSAVSIDLAANTVSVLETTLRENDGTVATQIDYNLNRISREVYSSIPNKLTEGRPVQVYIDRQQAPADGVTAYFWPVPDKSSTYKLVYYRMRRITDSGPGVAYNPDVPDRFWPALVSGLAYNIALKKPEAFGRVQVLKQVYDEQFNLAAAEDREKTSVRFYPGGYNFT